MKPGLPVNYESLPAELSFFKKLAVVFAGLQSAQDGEQWNQFIAQNGWQTRPFDAETDPLPRFFTTQQADYEIGELVSLKYEDFNGSLFFITYTRPGQNSPKQTWSFGIMRLQLKNKHPYVWVSNKTVEARTWLGKRQLDGADLVKLEGNFNKNLNVYIQEGSQVEALSFLAPDMMEVIVDSPLNTELELDGDNLFVMCHMLGKDATHMKRFIDFSYVVSQNSARL